MSNRREIKPFMVTKEQIEDYQFTKKQIAAYEALKRAQERCVKAGLSLFGLQHSLVAYPTKFYMNDMTDTYSWKTQKGVLVPELSGVQLSDSGADDPSYILDKYIK